MKKLIISLFTLFLAVAEVNANEIDKYIKQTDFELQSTVSVYVQNENTGHTLYKKNEQKLLNPASTLKTITFGISYLVLGEGYKFETALYKDSANNIYVKLGGDTMLSQGDLNALFREFKEKYNVSINNIYIDDTLLDKTQYPLSWMEEDVWPYARGISAYIIDKNYTDILIKRSSLATKVDIIQNDDYKIPAINELKLADNGSNIQDIKLVRYWGGDDSSIVNFQGTISKDEILKLPVLKPEINFNIKLKKALLKNGINYQKTISASTTPKNATKLNSVYHTIEELSKDILYSSDNFTAEVVAKVAAAKYINYAHSATFEDEIDMFNSYLQNQISEGIKIADASGVSRYNLVNSEFMTNYLVELYKKTNLKNLMATPLSGTLSERLPFLKDNLRAKTGTLSKMSSITGSMKTEKNNDVSFTIIVQNSPKRKAVLKNFENTVIGIIYRHY